MRFPQVRFTVRGLMIAVAVAAIVLGAVTLGARSVKYRRLGGQYDDIAFSYMMQYAEDLRRPGDGATGHPPGTKNIRLATRYRALSRKYWAASSTPWLPVAPDPPEPE